MPYLTSDAKTDLAKRGHPRGAGELNFVLCQVMVEYYNNNGQNYQAHNDILGALEGARLEWFRRVLCPYEDVKRVENGDVFYGPGEDPYPTPAINDAAPEV